MHSFPCSNVARPLPRARAFGHVRSASLPVVASSGKQTRRGCVCRVLPETAAIMGGQGPPCARRRVETHEGAAGARGTGAVWPGKADTHENAAGTRGADTHKGATGTRGAGAVCSARGGRGTRARPVPRGAGAVGRGRCTRRRLDGAPAPRGAGAACPAREGRGTRARPVPRGTGAVGRGRRTRHRFGGRHGAPAGGEHLVNGMKCPFVGHYGLLE